MNHFLHPRYWLVWLGMGLLRLITLLPWKIQMLLGSSLGKFLFVVFKKRRKISCINLELVFPKLSPVERKNLNRKHFISLTKGFFEAANSWWGTETTLKPLLQIEGEAYFDRALDKGKGVILLSAHFTSLELGGRLLSILKPETPLHVVYRPHQNLLIEHLVTNIRVRRYGKAISRNKIRDMIKSLKSGAPLWYAQDQSFRGKNSVVVPFFGLPTATNSATSRFAALTGATVIPFFTVRNGDSGYLLRFLPPLEDFPSDNIEQDTLRINQLIESQVKEFPEQYLWTHKRFKVRGTDFYQDYFHNHPESTCE